MGMQADIQEELIKLLMVWVKDEKKLKPGEKRKKILLVVEDLDRCTEERIIQHIDALRVILEEETIANRLLIITAIDERILKNAIRLKYETIIKMNGSSESSIDMDALVSEYLDKVFIMAVKLGELSTTHKEEYVLELLKNDLNETELELFYDDPQTEYTGTQLTPDSNAEVPVATEPSASSQIEEFLNSETASEDTKMKESKPISSPKLSIKEAQLFRKLVQSWANATPRRISILYYRYLLTKNLLLDRLSTSTQLGSWQDSMQIWGLLNIILQFGNSYAPESITKEKNRISQLPNSEIVPIPNTKAKIRKMDYLVLLEILELTIAY